MSASHLHSMPILRVIPHQIPGPMATVVSGHRHHPGGPSGNRRRYRRHINHAHSSTGGLFARSDLTPWWRQGRPADSTPALDGGLRTVTTAYSPRSVPGCDSISFPDHRKSRAVWSGCSSTTLTAAFGRRIFRPEGFGSSFLENIPVSAAGISTKVVPRRNVVTN